MENKEKERREIQRQEVELIKEVYLTSALLIYTTHLNTKPLKSMASLKNSFCFNMN
jgi:hypothetical protein